jgi:hypothetical protein
VAVYLQGRPRGGGRGQGQRNGQLHGPGQLLSPAPLPDVRRGEYAYIGYIGRHRHIISNLHKQILGLLYTGIAYQTICYYWQKWSF